MTHAPTPPMLCARCRRPLDARARYEDGRLVGVDYLHPTIALPEDHLPQPISSGGPASAVTVCDFCAAPGATWQYPARSFPMAIQLAGPDGDSGITTHRSQGAWGACQRCHDAIEAGDWNAVTYRALRHYRASLRPHMEPGVRALWRAFQQHRTGPPTPRSTSSR